MIFYYCDVCIFNIVFIFHRVCFDTILIKKNISYLKFDILMFVKVDFSIQFIVSNKVYIVFLK